MTDAAFFTVIYDFLWEHRQTMFIIACTYCWSLVRI